MSTAYQRGIVFFGQHRYDLAEREFRQELAEEPDSPLSHAFLALCLNQLNNHKAALEEADEAIRLDPGHAFSHYARGRAFQGLTRLREAEASAKAAISLDPYDADFRALLAAIEVGRRQWNLVLEAATQGLELDPEHIDCRNLRAMALVHLGRNVEASQSLGSALADDPENAVTHANQGWNLLHQGDHKQALEHFREALRLDPELEWARLGIIESLKARYLIYRLMLRFFLWMGRKSAFGQVAIIISLVVGQTVLSNLARLDPRLAVIIKPLLALFFGFVLLTWVSGPFFNFLLMFNRFGRLALKRGEKVEAGVLGGVFMAAAGFFIANLLIGSTFTLFSAIIFGCLVFPIAVLFRQQSARGRLLMLAYVVVLIGLSVPLYGIVLVDREVFAPVKKSLELFEYFVAGCFLSSWIPALTGLNNLRR